MLRVLGFALVGVGLAVAFLGGREFVDAWGSTDLDDDSGMTGILKLGGGGLLVVAGLGALNAGFLGASVRYAAGETMPVVKDSVTYLAGGQGPARIDTATGRTGDGEAGGPFCRRCGVRNDDAARFCDACGSSLG